MNLYGEYTHKRDDDGLEGAHNVHAAGVPAISSETLCGHIGRLDIRWTQTKKPVTCNGCLAVIEQVKKGTSTRGHGGWSRGYFCAVAALLREEGCVTAGVQSLFAQGGDAKLADPDDIELFRQHGMME